MHRLLVYKSKAYDIFLEAEDKFPSYEVTPRHGNLSKQPSDEGGNAEDNFPSYEVTPRHGNLSKQPSDEGGNGTELLNRQKRGWGSVLFTGASMLIKMTSLGLTLGSALTGGCMYYPDICTNREEIERLDKKIKPMTRKYEEEYMQSKVMYYNLKTATTNNGYIEYYINQTLQAVETLQDIESDLTLLLQIKLPKLSQMASATANLTYEEYYRQVFGTLEYRLSDLKQMLLKYRNSALIGIVVQFVIEATVKKFVNAIQTAYKQVRGSEDILASTSKELWGRMDGSQTKRFRIVERLKLAPKVLRQTAKNIGPKVPQFWEKYQKVDNY
ncbi:unnamed protein product [Mytilus edulis]|uniref:Uncharacterized protein n=1 Tax=Mytilus edulis TaxID=6550 RepID=A0A8S3TC40_MYTED|nr:unnamed protein product [Mytilus edulis]